MSSEFDFFLGPIINAAFFTVFLFGVITMQTDEYIRNYFAKDSLYIKSFVLFLWFTYVVFTVCICQGAYTMSVTDFGETFRLLFIPWGLNTALIIGVVIDHSVQFFFIVRAYRATGALYISIGLWTLVTFLVAVSLKLAQEAIHLDSLPLLVHKSSWLVSTLFFGDAALDVFTASVLIYYLTQQKQTAFKSTATLLDQLVRYTIQTGLATSFVAMGGALSFTFSPNYYIWIVFLISMPGSITIALLANINGRRSLIPAESIATGTNPLESGVVITHSRDVICSRDAVDTVRSQPNSEAEACKHSEDGIYGTMNVV
ncbi:hypothetical protein DFH08DRAFT_1050934 [Mycena albidolilacea]|uniref:DUF6534 domain-containing protein n=1 Tax=Mycena albidolilacea TaxID=1033008 RepID=A0AAD7EAX3_9AGAR|nr:hypothetical protein DFH08DRAFT_1050934 [Mycena albidolilacea]